MSDINLADAETANAREPRTAVDGKEVFSVPVVKSGSAKLTVVVDTTIMPDRFYVYALKEGLKTLANGGAGKITKEAYPDDAERFEAARALAASRVEQMYADKLKLAGEKAAAKGEDSKTMTEARRIARDIVKDELKKAGLKVSHYAASEITTAANELIEADPAILQTAKANLEKRGSGKVGGILGHLKADPKLVAKAEEAKVAKAANKVPLSAKQAGMTAKHVH